MICIKKEPRRYAHKQKWMDFGRENIPCEDLHGHCFEHKHLHSDLCFEVSLNIAINEVIKLFGSHNIYVDFRRQSNTNFH